MNILRHSNLDFPHGSLSFKFKHTTTKKAALATDLQMCFSRSIINHVPVYGKGNPDTPGPLQQARTGGNDGGDVTRCKLCSRVTRPGESKGCIGSTTSPANSSRMTSERQEATGAQQVNSNNAAKVFNIHIKNSVELSKNAVTTTAVKITGRFRDNQEIIVHHNESKKGIIFANVLTTIKNKEIIINVINLTDNNVTLSQGTKIGTAEYHVPLDEEINEDGNEVTRQVMQAKGSTLRELTTSDVNCGDKTMSDKVTYVLNKYRKACWLEGEPLGMYTGGPLEIKLKDERRVVNKPPYRIPYAHQEKLDDKIEGMLQEGVIKRSKSNFNAPVIIIKKSDGDIRPCMDYRALNQELIPVSFPLPRIPDLLNSLTDTTYISSLDLASAYHQCAIKETDCEKTAFTVRHSKYEFTRVPYGIQSAPGYFSRIINETLGDILGSTVLAYMDDVLVFTKTAEEHIQRLDDVLKKLSEANLKLKISKCQFFANEVKFLGYRVTKNGMKLNDDRVKAIVDMPHPTNKKQLQSLLGVCNYYRMFVKGFAQIAEPLYSLLRKNAPYKWGQAQATAVEQLKTSLCNAPIVKFPDFTKAFHIYTDASLTGLGATLMQDHDGVLHPLNYVSKSLNEAQKNYSATKLETLALVFALEQFRCIILNYPVHVYTDHLPLIGVMKKATRDRCLTSWALLAQEYAISLHYLPGKENLFADAMSRLASVQNGCEFVSEELLETLNDRIQYCNNLTNYIPEKAPWTEQILRKRQANDEFCINIKQLLTGEKQQVKEIKNEFLIKCKIIKGILFVVRTVKRGSQVDQYLVPYVPDTLMRDAFDLMHTQTTAGHTGYERTMRRFVKNFTNVREKETIKDMCTRCEVCIRAKAHPKSVPLKRYPVPEQPFNTVSSDVLGPLPLTEQGNQYILTIRDHTTRYTVLFALPHKNTESIIKALRSVISNYGSFKVLLTDNAQEYISENLKSFCKFYNIQKVEVVPYHPQSAGLAERINREINKLIRIYITDNKISDWDVLLNVLQLTINTTYNASLRETPFYCLFGRDSSTDTLQPPKLNYDQSDLAQHLARLNNVRTYCRTTLLHVQEQYTNLANVNRKNKVIKVGDRVYAKLDKQIHKHKLSLPISGPFIVIGTTGKGFVLKEKSTGNTYKVHPDSIIVGPARSSDEGEKESGPEARPRSPTTATQPPRSNVERPYNLRPR